jgi:phosphatidyl-myo-inositol dimannoside synthase
VKVLLVTPDFPPGHGGIQQLLARLVGNRRRVDYEVITPAAPGAEEWDAAQDFSVVRTPSLPDRRVTIAALNARALAHARRGRPDLVLVGHLVGAPAAVAARRALGIPFAVYLHALEIAERPGLAALAGRHAAKMIAVSRYTAGLARGVGVSEERIVIVPPGVEPAGAPGPADGRAPRILTVARLQDRYKGFDVMVRAMPLVRARVPDAEWVVVGDGRLRGEIARLAGVHGVADAIQLRGAVSDQERDELYEGCSVFAMPSRLPVGSAGEGFGIVYLEAATRGMPAVAGNVGGAVDAVVDGETGVLVDPTSHLAVAGALAELLGDPARARAMGQAAARFAQGFAWPDIAARVEDVLLDAAQR